MNIGNGFEIIKRAGIFPAPRATCIMRCEVLLRGYLPLLPSASPPNVLQSIGGVAMKNDSVFRVIFDDFLIKL